MGGGFYEYKSGSTWLFVLKDVKTEWFRESSWQRGNLFVNRLHLLPDDELISYFLIKSREHIVKLTSLYYRKRGKGQ